MRGLEKEIQEIPERAHECFEKHRTLSLPTHVPYIGMGASYHAPLTLLYAGADIEPQIASEYYYYIRTWYPADSHAVLISQSGESSETLWNLERFKTVTAVVNNRNSALARSPQVTSIVDICAGKEEFFSSTKTYVNTLIALYCGLGIECGDAVSFLMNHFREFQDEMQGLARRVQTALTEQNKKAQYVIGSGPNLATAYEGALILTETTKMPWIAMSVAQFDHGPKESSANAIVLLLNSHGKDAKRISALRPVLEQAGAHTEELSVEGIDERTSPIVLSAKIAIFMNELADLRRIGKTFTIGSKVTRVSDAVK